MSIVNIKNKINLSYVGAFLLGLLGGVSYIPFSYTIFTAILALAGLWTLWLQETSLKKIFIQGWLFQLALTLVGFNWVYHVAREFGYFPPFLAFITLLLFSALANLYIPLTGWLWGLTRHWLQLPFAISAFLLPLFYFLGETLMPTVFPWNFGYIF
ncbi:MAG: hypothetical protein D6797_03915, partial [Bdellovibrio sp.]